MSQGRRSSKSTSSTKCAQTKPPQAAGTSAQSSSATPVYYGMSPQLKPYWDSLPERQRTEVLSLSVMHLRERANSHHMVSGRHVLMQLLEASIARLVDRGTWVQWQWNEQAPSFETASTFRLHVQKDRVPSFLQKYLQTDSFTTRQAQQALRKCMQKVQKQLAAYKAEVLQQQRAVPWRQQKRSAVICIIFRAIESQHPYLFQAFAIPMIYAIQQLLPDNTCVEGVPSEDNNLYLALEDLEKMQPSHLNSMTCWLEKQVADVSRLAISPDALEEEYAARPFCVTNHGSTLAVTSQWIKQLEEHEEQTSTSIGDSDGNLLDWLYSTIAAVSPRMSMPGQTADKALQQLLNTLQDVEQWEANTYCCRQLLQMLERNKEIRKNMESKLGDFRVRPYKAGQDQKEIPPEAVLCLLCEEMVVVKAKRNHFSYLLHQAQQRLCLLNRQTSQACSEKDFLEFQYNHTMGCIGAPEQWHEWAKLADPRLKDSVDWSPISESARIEVEMQQLDLVKRGLYRCSDETGREIQQLQQQYDQTDPWSDELAELHSTFSDYAVRTEAAESKVLADNSAVNAADLQAVNQSYIRALKQFQKVTWPKLTTAEQSHTLFEAMQQQLKSVRKSFQEGCAVLPLMQAQVIHAACDNPGAVVLPHLILPMLRERFEAKAEAASKGVRSAAKSGRTSQPASAGASVLTPGPSIQDLQAFYSKKLYTSADRPMKREDIDRGLYCITVGQVARYNERKHHLYGVYADDLLLETIYLRPQKALEENSLINTFMGNMGPHGQTLAVAFCAGL